MCFFFNQINALQISTLLECIIGSNQAILQRDSDSLQRVAETECPLLDFLQVATKFNVRQGITSTECLLLNNPGGWQTDAPQRIAVTECSVSNYFQLVSCHFGQGIAHIECPYLNYFDARHDYSPY